MSLETDPPKVEKLNPEPQDAPTDPPEAVEKNAVNTPSSAPEDQPVWESKNLSAKIDGDGNVIGDKNFVQNIYNIFQSQIKEYPSKSTPKNKSKDKGGNLEEFGVKPKRKKGKAKSTKTSPDVRKATGNPQEWFKSLTENQKLYAMIVVLLKGLDRETLDDLYILAVENLRREGLSEWLNDARTLGLDDLLNSLLATEENGIIQMSPDYEEEVKHQIGNRYHMLWSIFENLLMNNDKELAFADWEFRKFLGQAVGRVGIRYPHKLENLLDKLTQNDSHRIVVIGGYALAEIVEVENGDTKLYEHILDKWVKSKRPDQFWAAAASIWRIYLPHHQSKKIKDVLWNHLETLVDDIDDLDAKTRNEIQSLAKEKPRKQVEGVLQELFWERVSVISDALDHMFDTDPGDVVPHLIDWLKSDEQSKLAFISQYAADEILSRISRVEFHNLDTVRWGLALFPAILNIADDDLIDTAFSALRAWLTSDIFDHENKQKILKMVVDLIDQATSEQLNVFRNEFVKYCFTSNVESSNALTALSVNLLTRTYFIDGYPVIPESLGDQILLADATPQGKEFNSLSLVSQVHPLITSVVKTYVYLMGYSKMVGSPNKLYQEGSQLIWHDLPRLMSGSLTDVSTKTSMKTSWLVALSYGPIIDVMDMLTKHPTVNTLNLKFYKSKDEDILVDNPHLVMIDHSLQDISSSDHRLQLVDDVFSFLIEKISQNTPEELWRVASQYVKCKPTVDQVSAQIEVAIKKLQDADISNYQEYYATSCLSMWLLKKENASAVKICINWLDNPGNIDDSSLSLGKYFGKFILRSGLYLDTPLEDIVELSLSLLRVSPDWTTFELTLENIEKYYKKEHQDNTAEMIAPSLFVSFLPKSLKSKMVLFLNKWIDDKKSPSALIKFSERLKFFIEIGLLSAAPDIEESKKFGLVFVDGDLSDQQYLDYALEFISEMEKMPLGEDVLPVLYRLGQKVPLAVGYGKHNISSIGKDFASPNCLNPILASYPADKVKFRAILIRNPIFDFDDKKQEWYSVPTIIFDEKRQSRQLDGAKLLYISPYDYRSRNVETIPDAVGDELSRMVKVHS